MPSIRTLLPLLSAAALASAQAQSEGCYSSSGALQNQGSNIYQSTGACISKCDTSVIATTGSDCYCGDELPPSSAKVADDKCDIACPGFPYDTCGGDGFFSVSTATTGGGGGGSGNNVTSSASTSSQAITSPATVAPTSSMSSTATSSTPSTSAPAEYTGAAAQSIVGAGAVVMGALFALL